MKYPNTLYSVSQKTRHPTRVNNYAKHLSIFEILSLLDSAQNLLQNDYYIFHHTFRALLHYPLKPSCFSYWQVLEQTYAPSLVCCCHAFSRCFHFSEVSSAVYQACISSSFFEENFANNPHEPYIHISILQWFS